MLRFKQLSMENFGPYKNKTVLDFPTESGVVIVRGRNGRGKTSILNAIRFVLFGVIKKNGRSAIQLVEYVNKIGQKSGNYQYKVCLSVLRDDAEYEITRVYAPKKNLADIPKNEKDYDLPKLTIRNVSTQTVLTPKEETLFLNQIMTDPVSRFYLFDGELLKEYEAQLSETDENSAAKQIRDGIEKILGVPILKNAKLHVEQCYSLQESAYNSVLNSDRSTSALGRSRRDAETKRDEMQKELDTLWKELEKTDAELIETKGLFEKYATDRELNNEREDAESNLKGITTQINDAVDERKEALSVAWKGLLLPYFNDLNKKLEAEISELETRDINLKSREKLILELQNSINNSRCELCKQPLDADAVERLNELLKQKENDGANTDKVDFEYLSKLKSQKLFIKPFINTELNSTLNRIKKYDNRITELSVTEALARTKLDNIMERIHENGSVSPDKLREISSDITKLTQKKKSIEEGINDDRNQLEKFIETIDLIDKKLGTINKSEEVDVARAKMNYLSNLKDLFDDGISLYKDELRKNVESDASNLFSQLSSEKEYAGLKINQNYGLDIIGSDGEKIPLRSSGYEHLVAFSLIGALHKNAPMHGPLFMDTSFGRLDQENSENLIRVLPSLSEQVIVLVHDREIDEDEVNHLIPEYIKAKYSINRISSRESTLNLEKK